MNSRIENNRLINIFIGRKPKPQSDTTYSWNDGVLFSCNYHTYEETEEAIAVYAKYDSDWNWLIPVLKTIREIVNVEYSSSQYFDEVGLIQRLNPYEYDIDFVFKGVVEFIKRYNHNKEEDI